MAAALCNSPTEGSRFHRGAPIRASPWQRRRPSLLQLWWVFFVQEPWQLQNPCQGTRRVPLKKRTGQDSRERLGALACRRSPDNPRLVWRNPNIFCVIYII
jgi:hypothetical protein